MSTITISTDIPTNINTLEKLAAWAILTLAKVNPTARILEVPGDNPERVAQALLIRADDGSDRLIGRVSIPLTSDYAVNNTVKFWQNAQEISNTAIPAGFKAN